MTAGQILPGRVVEITKDFVVIDVGLKSEGLVPINEFIDSDELTLGNEIEVLLDQMEGDDGQVVLSREKARRLRQWEYIVNHCSEGSIVQGKVIRKVKGGLMVDIGMEAFLPGFSNRQQKNQKSRRLPRSNIRLQNSQDQTKREKILSFPDGNFSRKRGSCAKPKC